MNFLAKFVVKRDEKKLYLCLKHMEQELQSEDVAVEPLPDDSEIGCQECSADFINN